MKIIDITNICVYGNLDKLIKLQKEGFDFRYNKNAINYASCYGHVHILEWFKNSGLDFEYDEDAIHWTYSYIRMV
jgi:hypothetical protein